MNAAELLVRRLRAMGVPHIYALCGNGLDPLLQASHKHHMRVIDVRNEQAAAYMADATGRLTRKLGVAAVSSGIGHVNALGGVCNAWFDGAPMLLLTGASDSRRRGLGSFQDMESAELARPLCKFSEHVDRPERVLPALEEAVASALAPRPGPVHLTIPMDVLEGECGEPADGHPGRAVVEPGLSAADVDLKKAAELIGRSEAPLIIAGTGVFYADAGAELAALAAALQAPVMVPIWDRGAVDEGIPEYCGVVGAVSGAPDLLGAADLVLLLGAEVDYRVGYLESPPLSRNAQVVRIEGGAGSKPGARPELAIRGDLRDAMRRILSELDEGGRPGDGAWLAEAVRRRDAFYGALAARRPPQPAGSGKALVEALRSAITGDTYVLVDGGNIGQWFHMLVNTHYPGRWLTCGRSGVVGWGLSAAAAVSAVHPGARVLLLAGDGSATFTIAELETAARQGLAYVAVIADDQAWGIVMSGTSRRGTPPVAARLGAIEFAEAARAFGARGVRVNDLSALPAEIEKGFASGQVTVLHVPIAPGGPVD
jgi:acetolactate synthase-1/2/3 large subunit